MEPSLYVSLSGQLALQRRLDTIANNVANSATSGFRAENVTFDSILSRREIAYSGVGNTTFSNASGSLIQTENPLDMAIQGDAYFAIATPAGTAYTRDGRFRASATGDLETLEGFRVLDSGGAPLQINPALGPVQIARNGLASQNGNRIGTIGLFKLPVDAALSRGPGAGLVSDKPGETVIDFSATGIAQGYVEGANVNPMLEMTRMIAVSRSFEALSASMDQSDRKLVDAIRALGGAR
ncbi:MAG: flagellar basal-body rod protein FlgF [Hyphomicrobium aestuarii]|nr:flagellar basal-body rod protein FlgF [Hyphomicrobium aestuarii]